MSWLRRKLTDKDLAQGTASCKAQHILPHSRVLCHEINGGVHLASAASDVHAEPLANSKGDERRASDEVQGRHGGAHDVVGAHHLRPAKGAECLKDVILGAVSEAIKQEVDAQQQQSPGQISLLRQLRLFGLAIRVEGEDGHASSDGGHDGVLVDRVALPENGDVEEHDGQQLAALGQQERDVVNVRETGVAKGAGQAVCDGDEHEGPEDAARGENRRHGGAFGGRDQEVDEANGRGEERLDGVEEDGEAPDLWCAGRAVSLCCQLFLEICPSQAIQQNQLVKTNRQEKKKKIS